MLREPAEPRVGSAAIPVWSAKSTDSAIAAEQPVIEQRRRPLICHSPLDKAPHVEVSSFEYSRKRLERDKQHTVRISQCARITDAHDDRSQMARLQI
jgi:hypothetical protein